MPIPLRGDEHARRLARTAYETLEPLHLVAYFNPHLQEVGDEVGLSQLALYTGARGGPLGDCAPGVVSAAFFNFNPEAIAQDWQDARTAGLAEAMAAREDSVDRTLREVLGDAVGEPALSRVASELRHVTDELPLIGRALSAAWADVPWPGTPHLALWHATALLRESRGDGHVAALVTAGLDPVEALVLHEAQHPDPALRRRTLGKKLLLRSRRWSQEQWTDAAERLQDRGLLVLRTETMTSEGAALYDAIELVTDDTAAAAWETAARAEELLRSARPFVKLVIDAGFLPGTRATG